MDSADVFAAIRSALQTGRAGTPVAARLIDYGLEDTDAGEVLDERIAEVQRWLGSDVRRRDVWRDDARQDASALLAFRGGQSALVSVGTGTPSPLRQAVVFGNHGTVSWESGETVADAGAESRPDREAVCEPLKPPFGLLLVAGDATHQPGYAEALLADGRCRLVGLADEADVDERRRRLNRRLAERLGTTCFDQLDEALARPDVHLVSICAEPYRRAGIIVKAAAAGKHLYLDKPLCATADEATAIAVAVRQQGVIAHMFSQVHWPPAQRVRAVLGSGRLGRLLAVHADLCFAKGEAGTARLGAPRVETAAPARFERADAKRELTNVGVYPLTLFLWALPARARRVWATTGNYFFAEHQARDMEDFGQLMLEMEDGVVATVTAGRTGWRSHPQGGLHRISLVGTEGAAVVDAYAPRVEVWSDAPSWQAPPRDPEDPMGMWAALPDSPFRPLPKQDWIPVHAFGWQADARHFLDCVAEGRQSEVSAELAAETARLLTAAYRSAATGRAADLPPA